MAGVWETDVDAYDWDTSTSWTGYTGKQNVGCPRENRARRSKYELAIRETLWIYPGLRLHRPASRFDSTLVYQQKLGAFTDPKLHDNKAVISTTMSQQSQYSSHHSKGKNSEYHKAKNHRRHKGKDSQGTKVELRTI